MSEVMQMWMLVDETVDFDVLVESLCVDCVGLIGVSGLM